MPRGRVKTRDWQLFKGPRHCDEWTGIIFKQFVVNAALVRCPVILLDARLPLRTIWSDNSTVLFCHAGMRYDVLYRHQCHEWLGLHCSGVSRPNAHTRTHT
jgi:hypothetical protein